MCDLLKAREQHNESNQVKLLKEIKNAISKEATRFSGYQQHVIIFILKFNFPKQKEIKLKEEMKKKKKKRIN